MAYLLPLLQILSRLDFKDGNDVGCAIFALIIVPTQELVLQLRELSKKVLIDLGLKPIYLFGSSKSKNFPKLFNGKCVIISTPGKLEHLSQRLSALKTYLKPLEVVIIDEADRYGDWESKRSLDHVLSLLPKQRRTGLFSATQAREVEELLKFCLMNPVRLTVTTKQSKFKEGLNVDDSVTPSDEKFAISPKEITNYSVCLPAELKLLALLEFLRMHNKEKILIFICSAAGVEYFSFLIKKQLIDVTVLSLHGKMKEKRKNVMKKFHQNKCCILFSTDLTARGIDVKDIDWVVQFDVPRSSKFYIHRIGRTGRNGREGRSIIFLNESESAYLPFIQKHENVKLDPFEIESISIEKAAKLREQIYALAVDDRSILELGSKAFVSYVESYLKHDCKIVCSLKDLDVAGVANAYGLLRMPRMKELEGRKDIHQFVESKIKTSSISYKNQKKEEERQIFLSSRGIRNINASSISPSNEKTRKRRKTEWEELQEEERLLKKFRRGKLSKHELNSLNEL